MHIKTDLSLRALQTNKTVQRTLRWGIKYDTKMVADNPDDWAYSPGVDIQRSPFGDIQVHTAKIVVAYVWFQLSCVVLIMSFNLWIVPAAHDDLYIPRFDFVTRIWVSLQDCWRWYVCFDVGRLCGRPVSQQRREHVWSLVWFCFASGRQRKFLHNKDVWFCWPTSLYSQTFHCHDLFDVVFFFRCLRFVALICVPLVSFLLFWRGGRDRSLCLQFWRQERQDLFACVSAFSWHVHCRTVWRCQMLRLLNCFWEGHIY